MRPVLRNKYDVVLRRSICCCLIQFLVTPKKMGAQTAQANSNSGIAAAKQIVEFFRGGLVKHQVVNIRSLFRKSWEFLSG